VTNIYPAGRVRWSYYPYPTRLIDIPKYPNKNMGIKRKIENGNDQNNKFWDGYQELGILPVCLFFLVLQ